MSDVIDEREHQFVDGAYRMLKQTRTLRQLADELRRESRDLRVSARRGRRQQASAAKRELR